MKARLLALALLLGSCLGPAQKGPTDECKDSRTVMDVCIAANQDCGEVDCNGQLASCGRCDVDHRCVMNRCIH
jgi:hypothetical protein